VSAPESDPGAGESVVGAGARFEGLLCFRGPARVDGTLCGEIQARGTLLIGPGARVEAQVDVDELILAGQLEGDVRVRRRTELRSTAQLRGSLRTPRLAVEEGGRMNARLEAGPPAEPAQVSVRPALPSAGRRKPGSP